MAIDGSREDNIRSRASRAVAAKPTISEDLPPCENCGKLFEELDEDRKLHIDLPDELD